MAKAFWPGFSWRILAHKRNRVGKGGHSFNGWWSCSLCGFKNCDVSQHPKSCPSNWAWKNAPKLGTKEYEAWRLVRGALRHSATVELHSHEIPEPVEFDELVIDHWFHLEQMSDRHYWMQVGDWHINVHIDGKKEVTVSMYEDKE